MAALFGLCGCHALMDGCYDQRLRLKHRLEAAQAWKAARSASGGANGSGAFGKGFRDGYAAVAGGGNGHLPTMPHRKYWPVDGEGVDAHRRRMDWYDGYAHGAAAALQSRIAVWDAMRGAPALHPPFGASILGHRPPSDPRRHCAEFPDGSPGEELLLPTPWADDGRVGSVGEALPPNSSAESTPERFAAGMRPRVAGIRGPVRLLPPEFGPPLSDERDEHRKGAGSVRVSP